MNTFLFRVESYGTHWHERVSAESRVEAWKLLIELLESKLVEVWAITYLG